MSSLTGTQSILTFSQTINKLLRLAKKETLTNEQLNEAKVRFTKLNDLIAEHKYVIVKKYETILTAFLKKITDEFNERTKKNESLKAP